MSRTFSQSKGVAETALAFISGFRGTGGAGGGRGFNDESELSGIGAYSSRYDMFSGCTGSACGHFEGDRKTLIREDRRTACIRAIVSDGHRAARDAPLSFDGKVGAIITR